MTDAMLRCAHGIHEDLDVAMHVGQVEQLAILQLMQSTLITQIKVSGHVSHTVKHRKCVTHWVVDTTMSNALLEAELLVTVKSV